MDVEKTSNPILKEAEMVTYQSIVNRLSSLSADKLRDLARFFDMLENQR